MSFVRPRRPARVDYTPVMISRAKEVARAFVKSPVVIQGVRKAKKGAGDVAKGLLQELGEGELKKRGKSALNKLKNQKTPERKPLPKGMSPITTSPIRTPRKARRHRRKLRLVESQRRFEENMKRIEKEEAKNTNDNVN